jgi:predicted transcriptional regulator
MGKDVIDLAEEGNRTRFTIIKSAICQLYYARQNPFLPIQVKTDSLSGT